MRSEPEKYFVIKIKTGVYIYEVQENENYRQSGHQKVWDIFLSDYGICEIELAECFGRLL
jgi:hypothetical protein